MQTVRLALLLLISVAARSGLADSTAYTDVAPVQVEKYGLRLTQILDPSLREFPASSKSESHSNPHLDKHRAIFVELRDTRSEELLFRKPAPNLTHLWIDPDSQFFVGISEVNINNRVQLIVYDRGGAIVHSEHMAPSGACLSTERWNDFRWRYRDAADYLVSVRRPVRSGYFIDYEQMGNPDKLGGAWEHLYQYRCHSPYSNRFHSSVTNFVYWFNEADPGLELAYGDGLDPIGLLVREPEWTACDRNILENKYRCNRSTRRFLVRFDSESR